MAISDEKLTKLKEKYKEQKGFLIPLLQDVQNEEGYLSKETIIKISKSFNIKTAEVYGVATFYSIFRLNPVGEHIIKVCKGTACHVSGADDVLIHLKNILSLGDGSETTSDNKYTLIEVACLGCCSLAPAMMIDDKTYGNLTEEKIKGILNNHG